MPNPLDILRMLALQGGLPNAQPLPMQQPPPDAFGGMDQSMGGPAFTPDTLPERAPQLPQQGNPFLNRLAMQLAQNPIQTNPRARGWDSFAQNLLAGASGGFANNRLREMAQTEQLNAGLRQAAAARNQRNLALSDEARKAASEHGKGLREHRYKLAEVRAGQEGELQPTPPDLVAKGYSPRMDPTKAKTAMETMFPDRVTGSADLAPNLTPAGLDAAALMFAKTGTLPPMGMGKAGVRVRQDIINRAAVIAPGLDIAANQATFGANRNSLRAVQGMYDAATAFEATALKNAKVMQDLMAKIPDTGAPWLNRPVRALAKSAQGSPEQAAYEVALKTVQPEFARILNSPTMAGQLTDQARREIEGAMNPNATVNQMRAAIGVLTQDAHNRRQSYQAQIEAIRGRIEQAPGTGAAQFDYDPATGQLTPAGGR